MLDDAIAHLRCPVCGDPLTAGGPALTCPRRHSFDIAKQGYVDLTAGRVTHEGDTVAMVEAREQVHRAGLLHSVMAAVELASGPGKDTPSAERLRRKLSTSLPRTSGPGKDTPSAERLRRKPFVVEVGAGTGSYLAAVLDAWPDAHGLAVDVSKAALRRAARAHPRMSAVRADVWRGLPLRDGSVDVVLDVFAPRSGEEFARIIGASGVVVVVTAQPGHLAELTRPLGLLEVDPAKNDRLNDSLTPWLERRTTTEITQPVDLTPDLARALIAMGPNAHHVDLARLGGLATRVTVRAQVTTWGRRRIPTGPLRPALDR